MGGSTTHSMSKCIPFICYFKSQFVQPNREVRRPVMNKTQIDIFADMSQIDMDPYIDIMATTRPLSCLHLCLSNDAYIVQTNP